MARRKKEPESKAVLAGVDLGVQRAAPQGRGFPTLDGSPPGEDIASWWDNTDEYYRESCTIVPEQIHAEYVGMSAALAYWNARYADAQEVFLTAKADFDILERELYPVVRTELEAPSVRVTEKMVETAMAQSGAWCDAKRGLAKAEADKLRAFGVLDAVRSKKEMLVSLGAQLRAEMQGDLRLREEMRQVSGTMGFHGG